MNVGKPQTISKDIFNEINDVIASEHYLDIGSFKAKKLINDARKLMNADPIEAHAAYCGIYQVCCEEEKMREHLRILNSLTQRYYPTMTTVLSNFGFHAEAQSYFNKITEPNAEEFDDLIRRGYQCYSLRHIKLLIDKAKKMKLSINQEYSNLTSKALAILESNNISDKQLAEYADVAGKILSKNRLMSNDASPNFVVADEGIGWNPPTLFITFKVNVSHEEASELYKELTYKLISKYENFPDVIHIGIESSL